LRDRKLPRVLLRIFLRRALEATELTDLGINFYIFGGSDLFTWNQMLSDCVPVKQ